MALIRSKLCCTQPFKSATSYSLTIGHTKCVRPCEDRKKQTVMKWKAVLAQSSYQSEKASSFPVFQCMAIDMYLKINRCLSSLIRHLPAVTLSSRNAPWPKCWLPWKASGYFVSLRDQSFIAWIPYTRSRQVP